MAYDRNTVLTHVYGIASLVPGIVSLVYLIQTDATWREYALVLSGWVAAAIYGLMLFRAFSQARRDGLSIGKLTEQLKNARGELRSRNSTLDFLSTHLATRAAAIPRRAPVNSLDTRSREDRGND
jgi:hypothetical protein